MSTGTEDLPGYKIATDLGYGLHSYTSNRLSADYMKGPLCLHVVHTPEGPLEARLTAMHGIIKLEVGPFSFPHKHLTSFAVKILNLLPVSER